MPRVRSNKPSVDVEQLLTSQGIPFYRHGEDSHATEGWIQVTCPFCGSTEPHLGFHFRSQAWKCWSCGKHSMWEALGRLTSLTGIHLRTLLDKHSSRTVFTIEPDEGYGTSVKTPDLMDLHTGHRQYLSRRRFDSDQLVADYGIRGCCPSKSSWSNRIFIPIIHEGTLINYIGRSISPAITPPNLTPKPDQAIMNHKSTLYGLDGVPGDTVVVVEGVEDKWRIGPWAVATFGTSWTSAQAILLKRFTRRFVMFDAEPEAQQAAQRLGSMLSAFPGTVEILRLASGDPDDLSTQEVADLRQQLSLV